MNKMKVLDKTVNCKGPNIKKIKNDTHKNNAKI